MFASRTDKPDPISDELADINQDDEISTAQVTDAQAIIAENEIGHDAEVCHR